VLKFDNVALVIKALERAIQKVGKLDRGEAATE
jgi:hypothetical protein